MEHHDGNANEVLQGRNSDVLLYIDSLKKEVVSKRLGCIKKKIKENREMMTRATVSENKYVESRDTTSADNKNSSRTMRRFVIYTNSKENDINKRIELTKVENLPSFTTWIPLDRNQRMTEDQSVVGRKQIYYDQRGGEALIYSDSDSDKEVIDEEEEKKEFTISEDEILRETTKRFGLADAVINALAKCFSRKPCYIKARYYALFRIVIPAVDSQNGNCGATSSSLLKRDPNAALNLFCRRCYLFNCRSHGCTQICDRNSENVLDLEADKGVDPLAENCAEGDGQKMGTRRGKSRFVRKRGKVRCSKFTKKSSGYSSLKSRISVKEGELHHHYEPCGCKSACGKDCLCLLNRTHCEKYCGCPRSCKNRFRGCRCEKRQCRTSECSCVAASRECDPDVCRNCFISCGDGTCGAPPQKERSYNCMNMRLLQNQHQKVLLGRSDVSGWGAFIKNACEKEDIIGEYRGELISHREAQKRGRIYDLMNSSYLFDLDDKYVIDARYMGNETRFINHSSIPNCYAKILLVDGDHRIGIFASQKLSAGQELFIDYSYKENVAPPWVKDHKASGSGLKKEKKYTPSRSRAKMKASGFKEDEGVYRVKRKALGSREDDSRSRVKRKALGSREDEDYTSSRSRGKRKSSGVKERPRGRGRGKTREDEDYKSSRSRGKRKAPGSRKDKDSPLRSQAKRPRV